MNRGKNCKAQVINRLRTEPLATYAEIADRCECSREYVAYVRRTLGLAPHAKRRRKQFELQRATGQPMTYANGPSVSAAKMLIGPWQIDELGNRFREIRGE